MQQRPSKETCNGRLGRKITAGTHELLKEPSSPNLPESGHGWAVRMLHYVQNHGWRHRSGGGALYVKLCVASPHNSLLLFYTYRDETCGSFKSRVKTSAKIILVDAEVEDWRLVYAGRFLVDACKLSAYSIELEGGQHTVHVVPSSRPLRRRTVMKYSS